MQANTDRLRLQIRLSAPRDGELIDFIEGIPEGDRSGYFRRFLNDAYAAGFVTPRGLAVNTGERERSLQIQLEMAREEIDHLRGQIAKFIERGPGTSAEPGPKGLQEQTPAGTAPAELRSIPEGFAASLRSLQPGEHD